MIAGLNAAINLCGPDTKVVAGAGVPAAPLSAGGGAVAGRSENPVLEFDPSGNLLTSLAILPVRVRHPDALARACSYFPDDVGQAGRWVADDMSSARTGPNWPRAIRIGSARGGSVTVLIPETEVTRKMIKKFVRQ
jgi:hypothetical protein